MENEQSRPGTSLVTAVPRRRGRVLRRTLVALLTSGVAGAGGYVGALMLLPPPDRPPDQPPLPTPAPAPGPPALTSVTAGVPAALPGLTALIGDREQYLRTHPRDARAWATLGTAYVERGRRTADAVNFPKAESALQASLREQPTANAEALDGLAALANARRDFGEAKRQGEQALELSPKRWTTYALLIDAYTGLGDYEAARGTLDKLMQLRTSPADRPAVMARASAVYRDRGWREDAAAQLADAAAAAGSPAEQAAYLERAGQLAWERGDREDALRHFEAAVRLDPDQRAALAGQGRVLAALGRAEEAVNAYVLAVAGQPSPQYALELGELYESLGRTQEARSQFDLLRRRAAQNAAGGVDDALVVGRYEADHGDPQEAVRRLRDEWQRQPGIEVADALGWALYRSGDPQEGLEYATKATDKEKGGGVRSSMYLFHLGMIERALGDNSSARRHLAEALQINPHFSPTRAAEARTALRSLGTPPNEPAPTW
ncbi:tetratricopeptide repeat protein [Streptomyces shenzhenensis]|uniref:tetratricopeptide repeat protein n=1 Tax=Streptomyces shenzhenensis TaxID=943815 RepID=UPI0033EA08C2